MLFGGSGSWGGRGLCTRCHSWVRLVATSRLLKGPLGIGLFHTFCRTHVQDPKIVVVRPQPVQFALGLCPPFSVSPSSWRHRFLLAWLGLLQQSKLGPNPPVALLTLSVSDQGSTQGSRPLSVSDQGSRPLPRASTVQCTTRVRRVGAVTDHWPWTILLLFGFHSCLLVRSCCSLVVCWLRMEAEQHSSTITQ